MNRRISILFSLLLVVFLSWQLRVSFADEKAASILSKNVGQMNTNSTIRDVVNHPSFKGFGRFVLPLDRGSYDGSMPLRRVESLLPYHSNVEPEAVVGTINYMIDGMAEGKVRFYDVYTEREKTANPLKKNTGLFFFRGLARAPFAINVLAVVSPMSVPSMRVSLTP
jgi:hypothetical protein